MKNEYVDKVANAIYNEIKENYEVIKINKDDLYEVKKYNQYVEYKLNEFKLHELLNPEGYKISGEIIISAHVYIPSIDEPRNLSTDKLFSFIINDTLIQFDPETEEFQICNDINVRYITLIKGIFGR
ncbi:hypothetical protein IR148_16205 [Dysgonomonas mossii]|uniref:Uncharacterized protein n=1 Tax=Dysgonomonas mossii TaxID=163665 RepID=A0A4Y9IKA7_9BACT|nr:hypothetical protein [Dysgonomonas mossii]MBF0762582.1 hypothetical protein [Dysgonomonas mossii]TFU86985.1 hypothetical protein E4T88_16180 [Dysgonomonas mossii]